MKNIQQLQAAIALATATGLVSTAFGAGVIFARMRQQPLTPQAQAMQCATTTEDFSDSGIAKCYTDLGLEVPEDL